LASIKCIGGIKTNEIFVLPLLKVQLPGFCGLIMKE